MRNSLIVLLGLCFSLSSVEALASEQTVQTLANNSCWYENNENFRVASFNDKGTFWAPKSRLEENLLETLNEEVRVKIKTSRQSIVHALGLHCGGYGSSLIARIEVEGTQYCAWFRFDRGRLSLRSFGGSEVDRGDYCDGHVRGQLLIGLKNKDQKALLEKESFRPVISKVEFVAENLVKVSLSDDYVGKENEAMTEIKNELEVRYIELNLFQHQVGEFTSLK